MPDLSAATGPRFAMTEGSPSSLPTVTVSLDGGSPGGTSPPPQPAKAKRNLLSTLKNSPSMLRRKMRPPHLGQQHRESGRHSWDGVDSSGSGTGAGGHHPASLSAGSPSSSPSRSSSFAGKEFHVCYQGHVRVATLQVCEAVNAVKKLAPELVPASSPSSSASSSTEDLLSAAAAASSSAAAASPCPGAMPRSASPTLPASASPRSPRLVPGGKSQRAFASKSCCLSISTRCVCIDDEAKLVSETVPIASVAYCATDLRYPRAVALIRKARSGGGSVLVCHVFVCSTRDKAEKIVAFIGKAFQSAWQDFKRSSPERHSPSSAASDNNNTVTEYIMRGRSRSYDQLGLGTSSRGDSPVHTIQSRYSSYELRSDELSSSPEDD